MSSRDGLSRASSESSELPLPLDLSHHFSAMTKNRAPSQMKQYYKYFQIPGAGNLAGGPSLLLASCPPPTSALLALESFIPITPDIYIYIQTLLTCLVPFPF